MAERAHARHRRSRRTTVAYPESGCKRDQLLGDDLRSVRPGRVLIATRTSPEAEPEPPAAPRPASRRSSSGLGHEQRPSAALEPARVLRLMICGRVRIRDEQRGLAGCGDLPDDAAGARDDEVGSGERRPEVVGEGKEAVPGAADTLGQLGVVPLRRRDEARRGPSSPNASTAASFSRRGTEAAAADEHHRPVVREIESSARVILGSDRHASDAGSAGPRLGTWRPRRPGDRVAEEDPAARTGQRGGSRGRGARRPRSARPGCAGWRRRAPLAPPRSRHRRERCPVAAAEGCGLRRPGRPRRRRRLGACAMLAVRGRPLTWKGSSSKPAAGTRRDSIRSGEPAKLTATPRSLSSSATARAGRTCPAVPPAAITHRSPLLLLHRSSRC